MNKGSGHNIRFVNSCKIRYSMISDNYMSLKDKLNSDFKKAFKSGDRFKTDVLRLLNSAVKNKEIELRQSGERIELNDEQIIEVLTKESKKRKDAIAMFDKGGRPELKEKEEKELSIVQTYLPRQLNGEEVKKTVEEIFKRENFSEFGKAMSIVMKELKGKADSKLISEIVKQKLEN